MVKATKEKSEYVHVKPDVYIGEYKGCQETQILSKKTGEMTNVLKHYWQVEVSGQKIELNELSDVKMTDKNKLGAIVEALLGKGVVVGETIDLDNLVGKKAKLMVKNKLVGDVSYNIITDHISI